jgi:phosphoribosylformylglycinamidine cyclo-ligase
MSTANDPALTYASAGVSIEAGDKAVELIKPHVRSTFRPEVRGDLGGFGALFALDWKRYREPLLVSSTDGVGTKSEIACAVDRYDTIGIDLVAMSADDVAVQGAEPLFFLDYVSVGELVPERMELLVAGVAEGCRRAGCALVGGEMSEHPGVMAPGEFDMVGFAVGVVERDSLLPRDVAPGDAIVGIASPGLRSNGYSLARRAIARAGLDLDAAAWPGADRTLGHELLLPSVIYARALLDLASAVPVHAFAHITGGGIPGNVARVLPTDCDAHITRDRWPEPRIFSIIQSAGAIADAEMEHVFNLGVGMVVVLEAEHVAGAVDRLAASGHDAWVIGEIAAGHGAVVINRSASRS